MRQEELSRADIGAEPIDPDLKACILAELATQPGSRVIKRKGGCSSEQSTGSKFCASACARLRRDGSNSSNTPTSRHEEKWLIFNLLMHADAKLEEVPGLGLKVTLQASPRH